MISNLKSQISNLPSRLLHLLQVRPKGLNVGLAHFDDRNFEKTIRWEHGAVSVDQAFEDPYGFIAVIVRLLADGAVDLAVDDALERGVLFVKADELDLAEASGFFGGLEALRSVVGEEADHAGQIRL